MTGFVAGLQGFDGLSPNGGMLVGKVDQPRLLPDLKPVVCAACRSYFAKSRKRP